MEKLKMKCRLGTIRILILALMPAATSMLTAAQVASRAGHVTIIAIMPETITLSINSISPAHVAGAISSADNPEVATGVTTAWSLMPGRADVATWATMQHSNAPVIIAEVSPIGVDPFPDGRSQRNSLPPGFAVRPSVSSSQMTGMRLTDTNRRGASTALLPDSIDPTYPQQTPANTLPRTLKIQVQPVL
ncbi:MAG TPA: hypothetical protein VG488_06115 [Candidatus Angelobacter sp.]|nr:hypothetical protein [Candidatus Angelobacter sp.]